MLKQKRIAEGSRDIHNSSSSNPQDRSDYYEGLAYQAEGNAELANYYFRRAKIEESNPHKNYFSWDEWY